MKQTPISDFIVTDCILVDTGTDLQVIQHIFNQSGNGYIPVVNGSRFAGIILREQFFQKYGQSKDLTVVANDLISKEIVCLYPSNTMEDAKELFDTEQFDIIPVTDEAATLLGFILTEDVRRYFASRSAFQSDH